MRTKPLAPTRAPRRRTHRGRTWTESAPQLRAVRPPGAPGPPPARGEGPFGCPARRPPPARTAPRGVETVVGRLGDHVEDVRLVPRAACGSRPDHRLVGDDQARGWSCAERLRRAAARAARSRRRALPGPRAGRHLAAEDAPRARGCRPGRSRCGRPVPRPRRRGRRPAPRPRRSAGCGGRPTWLPGALLEGVGEPLLDDAVRREVEHRRAGRAARRRPCRRTSSPRPGPPRERAAAAQPRLRPSWTRWPSCRMASSSRRISEGGAAGCSTLRSASLSSWSRGGCGAYRADLKDHHAHARAPPRRAAHGRSGPVLRDGEPGGGLALPLRPGGTLLGGLGLLRPLPQGIADQPDDGEDQRAIRSNPESEDFRRWSPHRRQASPVRACRLSRRLPSSSADPSPATSTAGWLGTSAPSTTESAAHTTQIAAGAANGKRCRPSSVAPHPRSPPSATAASVRSAAGEPAQRRADRSADGRDHDQQVDGAPRGERPRTSHPVKVAPRRPAGVLTKQDRRSSTGRSTIAAFDRRVAARRLLASGMRPPPRPDPEGRNPP